MRAFVCFRFVSARVSQAAGRLARVKIEAFRDTKCHEMTPKPEEREAERGLRPFAKIQDPRLCRAA